MPPLESEVYSEGERNTAARHTEIIVGTINHIPTEIAHPPDVRSKTNLETATRLAKSFTLATGMRNRKTDTDRLARR